MANEVDDIVQNVVLTGNEEVAAGFDKIQEAGEKAFDSLKKAAENAFSFTGLLEAVGGLAAAFSIAGVGVFEFVRRTEESVSQLSDLADQIGSTTEEMSGLRAAFAAGGVSADTMQTSFRRLSLITEQTWTEIKKQARDGADQLKQDALSVSGATIAAAEAQQKVQNLQRDTAQSEKSDLNSVQEARLRLAELNGQDVSAQRERLQLSQARLALDQATAKQADDLANAEGNRQKALDAAEKSGLDLEAARKKQTDDQKNDIKNVIDAVKALAAGNGDALKGINASTENLVKGIVGASAEGDRALGKMRGDITDLASPAPEVKSVFETLAKTLANLQDPAAKTALAMRLLGREVSQAEINVLSSSEKLALFRQRVDDLKLGIDETDKAISEKFRQTLFGLQNDISLVAAKIATAFGPAATAVLQALDDALISNRDTLINFATTLGGQVQSVVESFIRVVAGVPDAAKDQWLLDYITKLKAFAGVVGDVVGLIASIAGALVSLASGVADTLNSAFGTNINAVDVLFTAWFAKTAAGFIALRAAAETAATGIAVSFATVAARFAIITLAAVTLYEIIKGFHDLTIGDNLASSVKGLEDRLHAIREFLAGDFAKGIEDFKKADADQITREADSAKKRKEVSDDLKKTQTDLNKSMVDDFKSAVDKVTADNKKSVDERIADNQRLVNSTKDAATSTASTTQQIQRNIVDANKAAQTSSTAAPDKNGTVDENGIRNFGSGGNLPAPESLLHALMTQFLNALPGGANNPQNILDTEAFFGASFGRGSRIQGDPNSFPVLRNNNIGLPENPPLPVPRPIPPNGFEDFHRSQQDVNNPVPVKVVPDPAAAPPSSTQNLVGDQEQVKSFFHDTVHDFLAKAFSDPGSLTSPDRPERQPTPQTNPNNLPDVGQSAFSTAIESFGSKFDELISKLTDIVTKQQDKTITDPGQLGIRGDATDTIDQLQTAAKNVANTIESGGQTVADALRVAAEAISTANGKGDTTSGTVTTAASGGYITGPGTTTSDSIWARLSNREFVHNAQAVAHYGVDFMHAINNMQIPRFNAGGLVGLMSPQLPRFAFASGGLVNTSTPHLGTVDLSTDHGLVRVTVDRSSISQLRKAAVMKNMGKDRQPSWVK